jgi:hypothetical protein
MKRMLFILVGALALTACSVASVSPSSEALSESNNIDGSTDATTFVSTAVGKKVLFDLTKHEDAGNADWRIDGAYSDWAKALRTNGYTVASLTGSSITAASLQGASVLVIAEPQNPFSTLERNALISFVNNGGGLLMISDHRNSDRDNDGWDSPEVFSGWDGSSPASVSSNFQLSLDSANSFGLGHSLNSSFSDPVFTVLPLTKHPILQGTASTSDDVKSAGVYVGTSINVVQGIALLGTGGKVYGAANSVGTGRAVAYGDTSAFSDGTFSNGKVDTHKNWGLLSNANLGINMVKWLAKDL